MIKEFVPYQPSFDMKSIGFDEPCLTYYEEDKYLKQVFVLQYNKFELFSYKNVMFDNDGTKEIAAPTFSQAFRWFREKYNLKGHVEAIEYFDETPDTYHWSILNEYNSGNDQLTYEEAELECLKKLISIVKEK
jgi:hypothetical protein